MNNETYEALKKAVKNAARFTADEWPGIVEADDVEQDIWLRLLESPGSAAKLVDMNDRDRKVSLNKIGRQLAVEERSSYELFASQIHYSTDEVREILEAGALVGEGFNSEDERIDFDYAIELLRENTPQYVEYLWDYHEGDVASENQVNAWKRASRAVRKLSDYMNTYTRDRRDNHVGPGSRTAISTDEARYIIDNVWEVPSV